MKKIFFFTQFVRYLFLRTHITFCPILLLHSPTELCSSPASPSLLPTFLPSLPIFPSVFHSPILLHLTFYSTSSTTSHHPLLLQMSSNSLLPHLISLLHFLILGQFFQKLPFFKNKKRF